MNIWLNNASTKFIGWLDKSEIFDKDYAHETNSMKFRMHTMAIKIVKNVLVSISQPNVQNTERVATH